MAAIKKGGLGRGLDALFNENATDEKGVVTTNHLKLLPTNGEYDCRIEGERCRCKIIDGTIEQSCKFSQKIEIEL